MSYFITIFVCSFLATVAFGILFHTPQKALWTCGFVGGVGWCVYTAMLKIAGSSSFYANMTAAAAVSLLSEIFARTQKQPATIFTVTGIILLVPGIRLYRGLSNVIASDYNFGVKSLIMAGTDSVAIALGVMIAASVFRIVRVKQFRKL